MKVLALAEPLLGLLLALLVSGAVVALTGQDPWAALRALVGGALGSAEGVEWTLFYSTDMVFGGLAVAVAMRCGLFNIGAEGQATVAGLAVALVCLHAGALPFIMVLPLAVLAAAGGGAVWAAVPGWLAARRGGSVVVTTVMFNGIAAALNVALLAGPLIAPGQMSPETAAFPPHAVLPRWGGAAPLNLAFLLAMLCLGLVWLLLWHTRWGYGLRVVGESEAAARYAGISVERRVLGAMLLSGALAGGIALNQVMGAQGKLVIGFTGGAGFTAIAVALMGRSHPFGILPAALLFGALIEGGAELSFDMPDVPADLVVVIQGLVVLFTGALGGALRPLLAPLLRRAVR